MSWQAYIDTQLTATGQVAEACMLGKADASLWVDGRRIYEARSMGMRLVSEGGA